jgi:hypothetical protein
MVFVLPSQQEHPIELHWLIYYDNKVLKIHQNPLEIVNTIYYYTLHVHACAVTHGYPHSSVSATQEEVRGQIL